jgi:hypothetical protein
MLIKGLQNHFEGKQELTNTQALAAKTLLDRALPVLSAVEYTQSEELPQEGELLERIDRIIAGQPELKAKLWMHWTPQVLAEAQSTCEGKGERLAPLLKAHVGLKRHLLDLLQADLEPKQADSPADAA